MPITASFGALTSLKGVQTEFPGSGYFISTVYPGPAPDISCNPGTSDVLANCWRSSGYTIEFWAYYTKRSAPNNNILGIGVFNKGAEYFWDIHVDTNGRVIFRSGGGIIQTDINIITLNVWHNIAVSFSNSSGITTINIFVNGILKQTGTTTYSGFSSSSWKISTTLNTFLEQNVYIDELRISNSTLYTNNYSVATKPFIPNNDTQLLLHFGFNPIDNITYPTIIDSSYNNFDITNYPQIPVTISQLLYKF